MNKYVLLAIIILIITSLFLFGCAQSPLKENQSINIFAGESIKEVKNYNGLLLGTKYEKSFENYSFALEKLYALNIPSWRYSDGWGAEQTKFIQTDGKFKEKFDTIITYGFQDYFNRKYGHPVTVNSTSTQCKIENGDCFASFEELKNAWANVTEEEMKSSIEQNRVVDYYDLTNEPEFGWNGVSREQVFELMKVSYDIIKKYDANALIVAPGAGVFDEKYLSEFIDYSIKNDLKFDAISWHELLRYETAFESNRTNHTDEIDAVQPEEVVAHVETVKKLLQEKLACVSDCPEIHINEYAYYTHHLVPGDIVGWLYYFNISSVDSVNKACWDAGAGILSGQKFSTCWDGFDGLFTKDYLSTQSIYWVYEAHAQAKGNMLKTESTNARTVALAVLSEDKKELKVLLGRYGQKTTADLNILIKDIPFNTSEVKVKIEKIPGTGNKVVVLDAPIFISEETIATQKDIQLKITGFENGAAYILTIVPN